MRVAAYLRVSTNNQELEPQKREITKFCDSKGWSGIEYYADVMSASKTERAGLLELMRDVQNRKFDVVIAVKLDRLARSLPHFSCIIQTFRRFNTALVLTSQGIDTTNENPMGKMQIGMLAVFAEFERELIRERTIAGLAVAKDAGKKLGKPSVKLVDNHEAIVAQWQALPKRTYRQLAQMLGGVSTATAHAMANVDKSRCQDYLRKSRKNKKTQSDSY